MTNDCYTKAMTNDTRPYTVTPLYLNTGQITAVLWKTGGGCN